MKKTIFLSLFLIFMFLTTDCKRSEVWKGKIREVDGIVYVQNPKVPMFDSPILELVEELRIGEMATNPEYLFARISSLAIDKTENIYVADSLENHVKVFSPEGLSLRTIGQPGQGPGEFGRADKIFIAENGDLLVVDPARREVHTFSPDGQHVDSIKFDKIYPMDTERDGDGNFYVMNFDRAQGSRAGFFELLKLNKNLEITDSLVRVDISESADPSEFNDIPHFTLMSDGCPVFGFTHNYSFKILNRAGTVIREIQMGNDPVPVPEKIVEEWKKQNPQSSLLLNEKLPEFYQSFSAFFIDETGRILVVKPENDNDGNAQVCNLIDSDGRYLSRFSLNLMLPAVLVMTGGKLYVVEEDEDGNPCLVRYAMNWTI